MAIFINLNIKLCWEWALTTEEPTVQSTRDLITALRQIYHQRSTVKTVSTAGRPVFLDLTDTTIIDNRDRIIRSTKTWILWKPKALIDWVIDNLPYHKWCNPSFEVDPIYIPRHTYASSFSPRTPTAGIILRFSSRFFNSSVIMSQSPITFYGHQQASIQTRCFSCLYIHLAVTCDQAVCLISYFFKLNKGTIWTRLSLKKPFSVTTSVK